jgi:hypothetical protein
MPSPPGGPVAQPQHHLAHHAAARRALPASTSAADSSCHHWTAGAPRYGAPLDRHGRNQRRASDAPGASWRNRLPGTSGLDRAGYINPGELIHGAVYRRRPIHHHRLRKGEEEPAAIHLQSR